MPEWFLYPITIANFLHGFDGEHGLSFYTEATKICRTEFVPRDILPCYSAGFSRNLVIHVRSVYCGPLLYQAAMNGHMLSGGCSVELCANIFSTLIHTC